MHYTYVVMCGFIAHAHVSSAFEFANYSEYFKASLQNVINYCTLNGFMVLFDECLDVMDFCES